MFDNVVAVVVPSADVAVVVEDSKSRVHETYVNVSTLVNKG